MKLQRLAKIAGRREVFVLGHGLSKRIGKRELKACLARGRKGAIRNSRKKREKRDGLRKSKQKKKQRERAALILEATRGSIFF